MARRVAAARTLTPGMVMSGYTAGSWDTRAAIWARISFPCSCRARTVVSTPPRMTRSASGNRAVIPSVRRFSPWALDVHPLHSPMVPEHTRAGQRARAVPPQFGWPQAMAQLTPRSSVCNLVDRHANGKGNSLPGGVTSAVLGSPAERGCAASDGGLGIIPPDIEFGRRGPGGLPYTLLERVSRGGLSDA